MTETPAITLDTVVSPRPSGLVESELDGELTMMSIKSGKYYGLTSVASHIWRLLVDAQSLSVSALCDQLMDRYDVDRATCEAEVLPLLTSMAQEGLVTVGALPDGSEGPSS